MLNLPKFLMGYKLVIRTNSEKVKLIFLLKLLFRNLEESFTKFKF